MVKKSGLRGELIIVKYYTTRLCFLFSDSYASLDYRSLNRIWDETKSCLMQIPFVRLVWWGGWSTGREIKSELICDLVHIVKFTKRPPQNRAAQ